MCLVLIDQVFKKSKKQQFYKVMLREKRKGLGNLYHFLQRSKIKPLTKGLVKRASRGLITIRVTPSLGARRYYSRFKSKYPRRFHGYSSLEQASKQFTVVYNAALQHSSIVKSYKYKPVLLLCEGNVHTYGREYAYCSDTILYNVVASSTLKILKEVPLRISLNKNLC